MSQDNLVKIKSPSGHVIHVHKNKKKVERKLKIRKFDKTTRRHEDFTEAKK